MCRPEECPLQDICEQRVVVADAFLDAQKANTQNRVNTVIARVEQDDLEDENPLVVLGLILPALRDSFDNEARALSLEINQERIDQASEMILCPHADVKRKYSMFGPIIRRECGSDSRKERLAGHLERNPAVEGTTLENRTESR